MKSFKELFVEGSWENGGYNAPILSEELHHEIKNIIDSNSIDSRHKLNYITKAARRLLIKGEDTGLESAKPKKGSSRAVFFPSQAKEIELDGKKTKVKTAVKIAFPGQLDPHHTSNMLLGEHQNMVEGDPDTTSTYGIIKETTPGKFVTNPSGVLVPVFHVHPEYHHLEVGKIEKYNAEDLRNYTKNRDFKKGITHTQFHDALNIMYSNAHGQSHYAEHKYSGDQLEDIQNHPFVNAAAMMMYDSGMHPGDLSPRNMGVFVHPHTKTRHPVIADYGFTTDIARLYTEARRNQYRKQERNHYRAI